ncbi:uncharacterized protein LOC129916443 [Episyrphus balteatus]|uniref:uncharacterized protein LOC129916443 n=1 Tax=Episyrphus balteatus TaxID=286459 RepID=UPI0024861BBA|nr:uncharacterized protein LOC129916443 [Episyrphus balteatus]
MKFTIAIILMIATLASTRQINRSEKFIQECGTELNIPSSKLHKYSVPDGNVFGDEYRGKCFETCMLKKFGIMDNDSKFSRVGVIKIFFEENYNYDNPGLYDLSDDFLARMEECAKKANLIEDVCRRVESVENCLISERVRQAVS